VIPNAGFINPLPSVPDLADERKTNMLKLDKFSDTTDLVITHPVTGADLEHDDGRKLTVTAYSTESLAYQDALNKHSERMANVNIKKLNTSEKREYTIKLLADCIVSFNNFEDVDLGDGIVDPNDKLSILRGHKWLREQIDTQIGDLGNFVEKPSKSKKKG